MKYPEQFFEDLNVQTFTLNECNFQYESLQLGFKNYRTILKFHIDNYTLLTFGPEQERKLVPSGYTYIKWSVRYAAYILKTGYHVLE